MATIILDEMSKVVAQAIVRVVIYVRISKDRPDQTSTGTQEAEARAFCKARGWHIIEVCSDEGRSAYKRNVKRPAFDRAMRLIETKQATVFMVWKLDRFYRGLDEFNVAWNRIRKADGELVSVTEPTYDTTSNDPIIRWAIMGFAAMAEVESRTKADRSKSAHRVRIAEGRIPNGVRPFGYDKPSPNKLVKNTKESQFIVQAADRILKGESLRSVLRTTNLTGATGKPMTPRGLRFILTCPRTAGFRKDTESDRLVKGNWPAILPHDKWVALNELFDDPSRMTHTSNQVGHILSGLMTCGKDGCSDVMGSRTWKDTYRYQCRSCGNSIAETVADEVVKAKVLELCPQHVWESMQTQGTGINPEVVTQLQARLDELEIDQLMEVNPRKRDLMQTAIDRLQVQLIEATESEWLDLPKVKHLANEWDSLSLDEVRSIINHIANSITLAPVKGGTKNPEIRINVEGK